MVLIIISGLPSSGKTYRARQLVEELEKRLPDSAASVKRVIYISDHTLRIDKTAYFGAATEKTARAEIYSATKRALSRDAVVVLDSLNYIKGWRYQLHCEAKAVGVRSCVIHIGTGVEQARQINDERLKVATQDLDAKDVAEGNTTSPPTPQLNASCHSEADPYPANEWEELQTRFEEPNGMNRWDSPLYTVLWDDPDMSATGGKIWEEVVLGRGRDGRSLGPVRMNASTVLTPASQPDHLYTLDRITQAILTLISTHTANNPDSTGGEVAVPCAQLPGATKDAAEVLTIHLPASQAPTFAHLQRLRRQFIQLHRQQMGSSGGGAVGRGGGGLKEDRVAKLFVDWLNDEFAR